MVQEGQSSFCVLFFLKFIHFWLKDNCLTVLCWFLPNLNANQPWIYICALPLETPSHLPPRPTPLGCYRALVWVTESYTNSHWLSVFAYGNVYFQVTLSPLLLIRCLECSVEKDSEATFCFRGSENVWLMNAHRGLEILMWYACVKNLTHSQCGSNPFPWPQSLLRFLP